LLRPRVMVVFDALRQEILAAAPIRPVPGADPELLVDAARRRIEAVFARLDAPAPIASASEPWAMPEPVSNMEPAQYRKNVETAKEYIRAGDIFQVVPSQRFSAPYSATPLSLYRSLRRTNPSPFLYFFNLPGFAIVGSSPEILVRLRDGRGHGPPDRRHAPTRRRSCRRCRRWKLICLRGSEGARRAHDVAGSGPQ
jgi:anthranilate synthase component 1